MEVGQMIYLELVILLYEVFTTLYLWLVNENADQFTVRRAQKV